MMRVDVRAQGIADEQATAILSELDNIRQLFEQLLQRQTPPAAV